MKFYNSGGLNPRAVRMFMAEKEIEIPFQEVDIVAGENRQPAYLSINPGGQLPALEMEDGVTLSEVTSICEYLEEKFPEPNLVGRTAEERAITRMWIRRIDLRITTPLLIGIRSSGVALEFYRDRLRCIPEGAKGLLALANDNLAWLDRLMDRKDFICGDRFSLADIVLFSVLDFGHGTGSKIEPDNKNILRWYGLTQARPSAVATHGHAALR